ncbi:Lipoprotein-releasing system transmembrane protein LolE [Sedimentisphaera cyanobacteriorum]|uniref:Lipoprotein-releasing system transmembrane protein LolE n=1 Tax=Sedimentisphaera cyanobacteriorum TaxID=1940790 RepID=A0A1Q2HRI5_9BACT|nr:FtsX-like permease family protein [Sedimentisphaera cyanobacteriorum]AQQ10079.1 Lipoprotein-releasing system transmembrane protein LolE [Sedimentisphaera cyanobacteriorum]
MSRLENILAARYFRRRLITFLAAGAVAVSVFIVIVVMTIMNGLVLDFKERNHDFFGDCIISSTSLTGFAGFEELTGKLLESEKIEAASPVVNSYGLLSNRLLPSNIGVNIIGILPEKHCRVTSFCRSLYEPAGKAGDVFETHGSQAEGCIRGIAMMNQRSQNGQYTHSIDTGLEFTLTTFPLSPSGMPAQAGADISSSKTFRLVNDANSKLAKEDNYNFYVPLEEAQLLCGMAGQSPRITSLHLRFSPNTTLQAGCREARDVLAGFRKSYAGPYPKLLENVRTESWKQYRSEVIAPVEKEQIMLTIMFLLIGVVTVFVVLVVFVLIVSGKTKDIGILKSCGLSNYSVLAVFLKFASLTGALGAAAGALGAWAFLSKINELERWLFENYGWQLWNRSMYVIDEIPDKLQPGVIGAVFIFALLASLLGAAVPAVQAAVKRPSDTLRVENL